MKKKLKSEIEKELVGVKDKLHEYQIEIGITERREDNLKKELKS